MPILIIVIIAMFLGGCSYQPTQFTAGLIAIDGQSSWNTVGTVSQQGTANIQRVVADKEGHEMFEMAADASGRIEYYRDVKADAAVTLDVRLQFLSTQGTGRFVVQALDANGQSIATTGWIITGVRPANQKNEKWLDKRYDANYKGDWIEAKYDVAQLLADAFPGMDLSQASQFRIGIEVGHGQHVLISRFDLGLDIHKLLEINPIGARSVTANQGDVIGINAAITNTSSATIEAAEVRLAEPFGFGVIAASDAITRITNLAPGETRRMEWRVKAQRPSTVNLDKPWIIRFLVNNQLMPNSFEVNVVDSRQGKVYYVMTEDLEPIDSAGYATAWGNANGWLDPEEFTVQMVNKSEALNAVADRYGAKWTHYIAWPAVRAAEWAAGQSATSDWSNAIRAIRHSVSSQSDLGHEYGIHLHCDYDPFLPGNILSYNAQTNGFWANHLKHGWAHSIKSEGNFNDLSSRTGILYAYQRILDELQASSPQGQILTSRVGSFDFGGDFADQTKSTQAYRKVGLWGSSDADGNVGGITAGEYGKEIYFASPGDINHRAIALNQLGLVEFRPTPRDYICYDNQSTEEMNRRADAGMASFTADNKVKPGVHAITGFTHAMFVMGGNGWKDINGGQFDVIDKHLSYLSKRYGELGLLAFSTATELVKAYLDYYTPELLAVYGKRLSHGLIVDEYEVNLLGRDIPVDSGHSHAVSIKYPLYWRDSAFRVSIQKNGQTIYSTWGLPTPYNDIRFTVDDNHAHYTLKVYHNPLVFRTLSYLHKLKGK